MTSWLAAFSMRVWFWHMHMCMHVMCYLYHITNVFLWLTCSSQYVPTSVMYILGYAIYIVLHHSIHNVSYCDRVKGRSLVRDPNSGIFHDLVKGSTLACSPRPLWVLLLWHFLFSCWTSLDYVSKRYSQNVTLYNGRVLRYTALKPFSVI